MMVKLLCVFAFFLLVFIGPASGQFVTTETNPRLIQIHNESSYSYEDLSDDYDENALELKMGFLTDEQRLMHKLFSKYDRFARPVVDMSLPIVITMSLSLTQIFELDEKNQVLVTNCWENFEWTDEYMIWDPKDYADMSVVRMNSSKLWLPDVVLYNNAADFASADRWLQTRAMVSHDGAIFWSVPNKRFSSCKIDVTYFPFDQQECTLKYGSWTYDGFKLDLVNGSTSADLVFYVKSGEWDIISTHQVRNVVRYTCCEEPYPDVTFCIRIRRRALFYIINVFFPCFLLSGLTLLVFQLPAESGEKCGLGITIMLSFAVFMLKIIASLPDTSESFPLISIYLTCVMSMTAISICCTVAVLNLNHRSSTAIPVPRVLRRILNCIGPICCIHSPPPSWVEQAYPAFAKMRPQEFLNELSHELGAIANAKNKGISADSLYNNFLSGIQRIMDRHRDDDKTDEIKADWRRLAQYIDRTLFWLLFSFVGVFTIWIFLFYAPENQLDGDNCYWLKNAT